MFNLLSNSGLSVDQVARLVATPVTERQWGAFLDVLVGDPAGMKEGRGATLAERKRDELSDLWRADGRVSPWAGTAWGVLAAVNTHAHHLLPVRGAGRAERNMERMVSGYFDTLDSNVLGALDMVLAG